MLYLRILSIPARNSGDTAGRWGFWLLGSTTAAMARLDLGSSRDIGSRILGSTRAPPIVIRGAPRPTSYLRTSNERSSNESRDMSRV